MSGRGHGHGDTPHRRLRVFVSSRMEELQAERAAIRSALAANDVDTFVFELDAGARPDSAERTYLDEEGDADVYVGVFWKGYGPHTIKELEEASALGLDCLIYEKRADTAGGRDPRLQAVLDRLGAVEEGVTICRFDTADELGSAVGRDVAALLARRFREAKDLAAAIFHGVPSRVPADFVGRHEVIGRIARALRSGEDVAIDGLPGVGKTTLAVALAHHVGIRRHFRDGVLWASLGPGADAAEALAAWAQALERAGILTIDVSRVPRVADRSQALRDAIGRRRMLLVLDDVWEVDSGEALRCGGPLCAHLVTTRDKEVAHALAGGARAAALAALSEDEAWALLRRLAPAACDADRAAARALLRDIGYLPQAVRLVGGYLAQPTSAMFASVFTEPAADAFRAMADPRRRLELAGKRLGTAGARITLQDTIRLSLHDLPEAARQAFGSLGAFAAKPDRFTPDAAAVVSGVEPGVLPLLAARNLIEVDTASGTLSLHPTIADVARAEQPAGSAARHREHYLAEIRAADGDPSRIANVYGQIRWAWRQAPDDDTLFVMLSAIVPFQAHRGLSAETRAWAERALAVAEARGLEPVVARLLGVIGDAEKALGQEVPALQRYERELAIWRSLGRRDWESIVLIRIAHTLGQARRIDEALARVADARALARETGDRAQEAEARLIHALLLRDAKREAAAIEEAEAALAELRSLSHRSGEADCLLLLATIHRRLDQPERALDCVREAEAIRAETGDSPGQTEARLLAATVSRDRGRLEEALAAAREACAKAEAEGPHSLFLEALGVMADLLARLRRTDEALACYERQLAAYDAIDDRAGRASVLRRLAHVYSDLDRPAEELGALEGALSIYREIGNRQQQAFTLERLHSARQNWHSPDRAIACLRQALDIWRDLDFAADEARVLSQLGADLWEIDEREEALASYATADSRFGGARPGAPALSVSGPAPPALVLALGVRLSRWVAGESLRPRVLQAVNEEREAILRLCGVLPPPVVVADRRPDLAPDAYAIELHGVPMAKGTLHEDERLWAGAPEALAAAGVTGTAAILPDTGRPAAWVRRESWAIADRLGPLLTGLDYVSRHLLRVVRKHLPDLLGHQQTLSMVEEHVPEAARAFREDSAALTMLVRILRNLLEEDVPVALFRAIVQAVLPRHAAGTERLAILREIRLLPGIRERLPGNVATGPLVALPPSIEREIGASVQVFDGIPFLSMAPDRTQYVLATVRQDIVSRPDLAGIVAEDPGIRRYLRRLVELEFPDVQVVSREELLPSREDAVVGGIGPSAV